MSLNEDWHNMVSVLNTAILMVCAEQFEAEERDKQAKSKGYWVCPYLKERNDKGRFATDFENLKSDPRLFIENFRMPPEVFEELYTMLEPHLLRKRNTRPKDFIPEKAKLPIVIEYLASGDLQRHIASCYRISKCHFGAIIAHVCDAICLVLKDEIREWTPEKLIEVADGFQKIWNFPNCIGAIDGKHVAIQAPAKSGSIFYNYKGFHSIVLLATCDAYYRFTYLDVGAYGSEGDANVFKNSKLGGSLINDTCPFPPDAFVGGKKIPHFIVADDAFPLGKRILKPNNTKPLSPEERIFNYRLSRARRCIENAFGILSSRWLCLKKTLFCGPARAQTIVSACCCLHNYLLNRSRMTYCAETFAGFEGNNRNWVNGEWESNEHLEGSLMQTHLGNCRGRSSDYGKCLRNILKDYVNSPDGAVPWQNEAAFL